MAEQPDAVLDALRAFFEGRYGRAEKAAASAPKTGIGRAWARAKAVAIGRPLASEEEIGERLSKTKALAVFSSDAISSSAYASEEILRILVLAGGAAVVWSVPIALAIAGLLLLRPRRGPGPAPRSRRHSARRPR